MGIGAFVIGCIANAIGSLILMFPLAALAVKGHRKAKLGWGRGFVLLGVAVLLVSLTNFILFKIEPSLMRASELTLAGALQMFLVPLTVSLAVLYAFWRPHAP